MPAGSNVLNSELLVGRGAIQLLFDVLGSGPLGGRGAIQTSSGEAMGLRGLCFLGMLTTTQTKSTHPPCMRFPTYIRMPVRGIEDVETFPLLETQMEQEIRESGHRNSIT